MQKKILIIEDEPLLLEILRKKMQEEGFSVISATDGESGLEKAKMESFDLILLDLILPAMTGFEVLEQLKSNPATKDITVIILSNLGQEEEVERGLKLGAALYFVKAEIGLGEVVKKVRETLGV
ncbi:MAG: response regulator [Candidatus Wildermuthbacteria bacterium]|nr:response regulator [Candidatus Wildermuthbacteria bacterium]